MPRARAASSLLRLRLGAQLLGPHTLRTPAEVVAWMGAIQAQDFGAARWAVGVRLPGTTDADVARAISDGAVLRLHLFRGTWQLVARADVRWMLDLVGPRVLAARAARERELGLDAGALRRGRRVLERALAGGDRTRAELLEALAREGMALDGNRLSHLLGRAELEGLACSGALRGRTPTWALLAARVAPAPPLGRAEALRELALRHVRGRGPVTAADLAWWGGITLGDARAGLEAARPALAPDPSAGVEVWRAVDGPPPAEAGAHLLPAFDEYLVGYRDRSAALADEHARVVNDGGGMLSPCAVVQGRVVGLWRRAEAAGARTVELAPFAPLATASRRALQAAVERYGTFLGRPHRLAVPRAADARARPRPSTAAG